MKVILENRNNGKRAYCEMQVPTYSACYANHGDLLKWAKKVGAVRALKKAWNGESIDPFIEYRGETPLGICVYRNAPEYFRHSNGKEGHYYRDYVERTDNVAFWVYESGEEAA